VLSLLEAGKTVPGLLWILCAPLGIATIENGWQLDTEFYDTPEEWLDAYEDFVLETHQPWAWTRMARPDIDYKEIQDIAVGNWSHTVVTFYILDAGSKRIYYIDEEPLMLKWEPVPYSDTLSLTADSRIDADHSVICATTANKIHWVRFDFHQPDKFPILNWTEIPYDPMFNDESDHPGWHQIHNPSGRCDRFRIDVSCASGTSWPIPPTLGIGYIEGWEGILGDNPVKPPWTYPVRITISSANGHCHRIRLGDAMQSLPSVVVLDGRTGFAFDVASGLTCSFEPQDYPAPNDYLSPLTRDYSLHAKDEIIIRNGIVIAPRPDVLFHAETLN
jgi:hypothetical protein